MEAVYALPIIISLLLALGAGALLHPAFKEETASWYARRQDLASWAAMTITSLGLLFYATGSLWEAVSNEGGRKWEIDLWIFAFAVWSSAFVFGLKTSPKRKVLSISISASVMFVTFWIVEIRYGFTWGELLLVVGLTFWVCIRIADKPAAIYSLATSRSRLWVSPKHRRVRRFIPAKADKRAGINRGTSSGRKFK